MTDLPERPCDNTEPHDGHVQASYRQDGPGTFARDDLRRCPGVPHPDTERAERAEFEVVLARAAYQAAHEDAVRAEARVAELEQSIWDAAEILGEDHDGDPTPAAMTWPPLDQYIREVAQGVKADYLDDCTDIKRAEAALARVRALHRRESQASVDGWCSYCLLEWPCRTVAALDGAP